MIDEGVNVAWDETDRGGMASIDPVQAGEILTIYDTARTNAFR